MTLVRFSVLRDLTYWNPAGVEAYSDLPIFQYPGGVFKNYHIPVNAQKMKSAPFNVPDTHVIAILPRTLVEEWITKDA
jgi:hypothetical protein